LGERVRKIQCELQFNNSKYLKVDNFIIPFKEIGNNLLNVPVQAYTGMKRVRLSGWSRTPQVTMINDTGLPVTLLSLTTEVKFGLGKIQEAG